MIKLLETDEEKLQIKEVLESRNTYQLIPMDNTRKSYVSEMTYKNSFVPGSFYYGDFDTEGRLTSFVFFHEWLNHDKQYSLGTYAVRANTVVTKTIDQVNPDIVYELINYGVTQFEDRGFEFCYNAVVDNQIYVPPFTNPACKLYDYTKELVQYVEPGDYFPIGEEPTGGEKLALWKRPYPFSYMIPFARTYRMRIIKMTKPVTT